MYLKKKIVVKETKKFFKKSKFKNNLRKKFRIFNKSKALPKNWKMLRKVKWKNLEFLKVSCS